LKNSRILILTPTFSSGGAEHIAINIANYYSSIGRNVTILCFLKTGPYLNQISDKVAIINLEADNRFSQILKLKKYLNLNPGLKVISTVRNTHIAYGLAVLTSLNRVKKNKVLFLEVNTFHSIKNKTLLKRIIWYLIINISYFKANTISCCSLDVRSELEKIIPLYRNKLKIIGNPVIPEDFNVLRKKPIINPHRWIGRKDLKIFLHVGRLHFQKNQEFLIKAFSKHIKAFNNSRLLIIGEGEDSKKLKDLVRDLQITNFIDFIGFIDNLFPIIMKSDIFVMTSRWEGFGNVFIMAMACGTPILSSNCKGGPKELIKSKDLGLLYKDGSFKDFIQKSKKIIEYKKEFKSMRCRYTASQNYTIRSIANNYFEEIS
jgi:glycosyltransferase involved in cell wall biosynthesis